MASGGMPQWRAERLLGLLTAGGRLRPERQPRELFADHPQLVLRAGFAEPVDQPDQRADMLLGQFKELLGCLGRHRTSSGRTATLGPPCVLRLDNVTARGRSEGKRLGRLRPWRPLGGQACARSPSGLESIPARCNGLVALALSDGAA